MHAQQDRLQEAFALAEQAARDISTAELQLMPRGADQHRTLDMAPPADPVNRLTPREQEVAHLMAFGMPNAAIAEELVIATNTVKTHVKNLVRKLGAVNRADAVARYLRHLPG
ncbi:MAG: response regulator transcription factor [Sporichthyaceae bacterium]